MFTGFGEDGEATYDSKDAAIERARQLLIWENDPDGKIFIHRRYIPLWFAHIVQGTFLEFLAWYEHKSKKTLV